MRAFDFQLHQSHTPLKFLTVISAKLNVNGDVQGRAARIVNKLIDNKWAAGKNPKLLPAAILYVAAKEIAEEKNLLTTLTQADISSASGVTEVSIRNNYKWISRELSNKVVNKEVKIE